MEFPSLERQLVDRVLVGPQRALNFPILVNVVLSLSSLPIE